MGKIQPVPPAAFIAGITFAGETVINGAMRRLTVHYGPIAFQSEIFDFTMTDYYIAEMGQNLRKCFYCFEEPVKLDMLPDIKRFTNDVEIKFARGTENSQSRTVNIDPGYVTLSKLVLATTKDYSHRMYIGSGIYGEVTLHYLRGTFTPFSHTYPDYQTPLAIDFFNRVRAFVHAMRTQWNRKNE